MISTLAPRIVFVGDYGHWSKSWMDLDDELNTNLSRVELGSYNPGLTREERKQDKFSRFIDSSEFVVRCSKLRTLSSSGQSSNCYGQKTDAVVTEGKSLNRICAPEILKKYLGEKVFECLGLYGMNPTHIGFEEHYYSLELTKGIHPIKSYGHPAKERPSILNPNFKKTYQQSFGRTIISSANREIWFPIGRTFCTFSEIMFKDICGLVTPTFLKNHILDREKTGLDKVRIRLSEIIDNFENVTKKYSEYNSLNTKTLSLNNFLELRNLIDGFWISFEDMDRRWGHKIWWKEILERRKGRLQDIGMHHAKRSFLKSESDKEHTYSDSINLSRSAMHVNRGVEAIWIAMNDERFKEYEFYMIGYYGLDQQFSITPYLSDQLVEYLFLTDLVKSKKIKYLPEHIDDLNEQYDNNCYLNGIPIYRT